MPDAPPQASPLQSRDDSRRRSAVVVTVEHERGRTTLSVPDDEPVELLLPLVVGACGADGTASWALAPRGGRPLDGARTLGDQRVWQGAILALRQIGAGEARRPRPAAGTLVERLPREALARARAAWRDGGSLARLERTVADAPRRRGVVIAVASLEAGCGKTTVAALLATLLVRARPSPPLVVDGDLGSRTLSRALAPTFRMAPEAYLDVVERRLRLTDLRPAAIGPAGIRLLPAPDDPQRTPAEADCTALIGELRSGWGVTLLDCAAGFGGPWARAAWAAADQFVLVGRDAAALQPVAATLEGAGVAVAVVPALARDHVAATLLRAGELAWPAAPRAWRLAVAGALAALAVRW